MQADEDTELGAIGRRKPPSESPPTYDQATWTPLRSFTNPVSSPSLTTWYCELLPVLATIAVFTTILGIAESICYAIYNSPFHAILPSRIIYIPLVGGGPLQIFLVILASCCYRGRSRYFDALCGLILSLAILCGIAIPAVSFILNWRASGDTSAIVNALQALPPGALNAFADEYQSCTYNIPANHTDYQLDIVPMYLDQTCRYAAIACNVPVQVCFYSYKAYSCSDSSVLKSINPCNTLARVAYQVKYDWEKYGKSVDAWAMGVWGFWFLVLVIFYVRVRFAGL